jgi:hypothetical protein
MGRPVFHSLTGSLTGGVENITVVFPDFIVSSLESTAMPSPFCPWFSPSSYSACSRRNMTFPERYAGHRKTNQTRLDWTRRSSWSAIQMPDKTYLLQLKPPELSVRAIIAATAEIHGEHLVLLDCRGQLVALFVLDMVESWNEL